MSNACTEKQLQALVATLSQDDTKGRSELDRLLETDPEDPRLLFLKGSMLAASADYARARDMMRKAVDVAPDFAIARFQLGFLLLTCGEGHTAQEAWGPLHGLPSNHYLHIMVIGLTHLIHDQFDQAIDQLNLGIAHNQENPALNGDMQMIIGELRRKKSTQVPESEDKDEPMSAVDLLLRQSTIRSTRH